ncbi:MAG TPA: GGDEF domain-containing protein, partial [Rhodobacterales bacterium]|nr:GGDEF domain-containing protein [Rhodobacterales bacterium]
MVFDTQGQDARPQFTNADLARRKELLELTAECEATLAGYQPLVRAQVDEIVRTFYEHQTKVPEIKDLIRNEESLARLKQAMRSYVVDLFAGTYGASYAHGRTKIGQAHARLGVAPWLYIAS